jgi:hypothetical protein
MTCNEPMPTLSQGKRPKVENLPRDTEKCFLVNAVDTAFVSVFVS